MYSIDTPEGMAAATAWTQRTIDMLAPGGVWAIPRAGTAYAFDKDTKEFTLKFGEGDSAVEKVLENMGWTRKQP